MSNTKPALYIGLMSGTSLDSIDAALIAINETSYGPQCQLIAQHEHPIPSALRQQLLTLCQPGKNEIDAMGSADRQLALTFADACNTLMATSEFSSDDITAIGSHGQTIRHRPDREYPFTLQIGDPSTIAYATGITTVADFRRKDIAAGGQGAPLAPAFHQAAFSSAQHNRAIINIGGMANISCLARDCAAIGFDTGPGNVLMNCWIEKNKQQQYDHDGQWAASGEVNSTLLAALLAHPYLEKPAPKSTGREDFNLNWLEHILTTFDTTPEDVQATLLEFSAQTITDGVERLPVQVNQVFICGGGAYNSQLMERLESLLHPRQLGSTKLLGIAPEWVEAAAFAWLAQQTLARKPGSLATVTGACEAVVLGGIYYP
ncbi:MAG: anhydro-N-acetylmuramic acid kinase [Oceanicoccus sp.]|jgi:anhydro-N-acetylmuramic acid kinase